MSRDKIADNGGELTDLQSKATVLPRGNPKRILIQANLGAVIARIETAIESRLGKEINVRAELSVEEKCQARVEEIVDVAVDEPRCWLLEMIKLDIDRAAQTRSKIILERSDSERVIEAIKNVIDLKCARHANEKAEAERAK